MDLEQTIDALRQKHDEITDFIAAQRQKIENARLDRANLEGRIAVLRQLAAANRAQEKAEAAQQDEDADAPQEKVG